MQELDVVIATMQGKRDALAKQLEGAYTELGRAFFMNAGNAPHAVNAAKLAGDGLLQQVRGLDVALTELEKLRG